MRIAQLTKYFYPHKGGIESSVLGISGGIAGRGNDVLVFTSNIPKCGRKEVIDGIEVHRFANFFTMFNDPFTPGIITDLLKEDYDLIHLHLPDPFNSIFALIASILRKKPLIVTYHADIIKDEWYHKPFKFIYNLFLYFVLRHSRKIIATTPNYVKDSCILRRFKNKMEIVPNFVDIEKFNPGLDGSRIRKVYNLNEKKIILFIGRLVPYKGVEYLITAFSDVKKELENSALLIVGNGPLKEKLENLAADIGDVYFINAEDRDIPFYYACCDLFVLPSITRQEAFGIVLLEAMASGKPVIATNISGMPYIINNSGIVVKPKNIDGLKDAILKILSNPQIAAELGENGRKRVETEFAPDIIVDKIEKIYISVR